MTTIHAPHAAVVSVATSAPVTADRIEEGARYWVQRELASRRRDATKRGTDAFIQADGLDSAARFLWMKWRAGANHDEVAQAVERGERRLAEVRRAK